MNIEPIKKRGKTKHFKLENDGHSIQIALGLVNSSEQGPVVQANYLITQNGEKITKWKKNGSFIILVQKLLDCEIHGTRQKFIDKIYYSC